MERKTSTGRRASGWTIATLAGMATVISATPAMGAKTYRARWKLKPPRVVTDFHVKMKAPQMISGPYNKVSPPGWEPNTPENDGFGFTQEWVGPPRGPDDELNFGFDFSAKPPAIVERAWWTCTGTPCGNVTGLTIKEAGRQERFEEYQPGPLPPQSDWIPWNDDPNVADFRVTTQQSLSPPHALAIDRNDDAVLRFEAFDAGIFVLDAWLYVPRAMNETQYVILLNTYPAGFGPGWSLVLALDGAQNTIRDGGTNRTLPLVEDAWSHLHVEIDLDRDHQAVFYDGDLLVEKSWTAGIAEGGAPRIAAIDLWGNGSAAPVFYDDMVLMDVTPCHGDLDGDNVVGFGDLLAVLAAWGACGGCPEDLDGDGAVGFSDVLVLLSRWGICP